MWRLDDAGIGIGAAAQLALLWHCSEERAASFLYDAYVLRRLGGRAVMDSGLLTVEQALVVEASAGVEVWRRDGGLMDLAARALTGPNAQACMAAIRRQAEPVAVDDRS